MGSKLFGHIYNDLCIFENEVLKVENMKFRIEYTDKSLDKIEGNYLLIFE